MIAPDFRGARGSNAGDDFHELWAIQHAIRLLDPQSGLVAVTVEGLLPEDESMADAATWDGVDCGLYYGGATVPSARSVIVEQLKYSAADPNTPWTIARLTYSSAKKTNNSVIRRLGSAFSGLVGTRGNATTELTVRFVSNQPIDSEVLEAVKASVDVESNASQETQENKKKLQAASGLSNELFPQFCRVLDLKGSSGARFAIAEAVLRTIASWTDDDARAAMNQLLFFIRRQMQPEGKGQSFKAENVLLAFDVSSRTALFPCPPRLKRIDQLVHRPELKGVSEQMIAGKQFICLHGHGGSGKTTALQELQTTLPPGSATIVYDCYGAGHFLDSNAYRHRKQDAFLQLSNDLSTATEAPLMITRSASKDYARAFQYRVTKASEIVAKRAENALLVIAIDAADNAIIAGAKTKEPTFVPDFVHLGDLPQNVRLVLTTRTGRLKDLELPEKFLRFEIPFFNLEETAALIRQQWPGVARNLIEDFQHLSGGNPRVLSYAIEQGNGEIGKSLESLRPTGKRLEQIFSGFVEQAIQKSGGRAELEPFAAALTALPRPIPIADLSAIAEIPIAQLRDICSDLSPGLRIVDDRVGISDEDFEDFLRALAVPKAEATHSKVANHFFANRGQNAYAALHLASALYDAGRGRDVIGLIESPQEFPPSMDPFTRHQAQLDRIRIAMRASREQDSIVDVLRTILLGAEALKTDDAVRQLVFENPDLAAVFMRETAIRLILADSEQVERHGRLLAELAVEEARSGKLTESRETWRQFQAWLSRRNQHKEELRKKHEGRQYPDSSWPLNGKDIAAEFETVLLNANFRVALSYLERWMPRTVALEVAQELVPRLIVRGKVNLVEQCLAENLLPEPWTLLLLVPLAIAGREIDIDLVRRALKKSRRQVAILAQSLLRQWQDKTTARWLDTIVTACELVIARIGLDQNIKQILEIFADEKLRISALQFSLAPELLDAVIRCFCMIQRSSGETPSVETFLLPKRAPKNQSEKYRSTEAETEERDTLAAFLPIYDARAQVLLGKAFSANSKSLISSGIGSFHSQEYRVFRRYAGSDLRRLASLAISDLLILGNASADDVSALSLAVFTDKPYLLEAEIVPVLSILSLNEVLHPKVVAQSLESVSRIAGFRVTASEKVGATIAFARLLLPISRTDAEQVFGMAHRTTEELDVDAIHLLRALSALSIKARTELSFADCRERARDFISIITDAAIRLSDRDGFPWKVVTGALGNLDSPMAMAAVAKWEDSGIVRLSETLPALLEHFVSQEPPARLSAAALIPLLSSVEPELMRRIIDSSRSADKKTRRRILTELSKDELIHFRNGCRRSALSTLEKAADEEHLDNRWTQHVRDTLTFVRSLKSESETQSTPPSDIENIGQITAMDLAAPSNRYDKPSDVVTAIVEALKVARSSDTFRYTRTVFSAIRQGVHVGDRTKYLTALTQLPDDLVMAYDVARELSAALAAWESPSVADWAQVSVPAVIVKHLTDIVPFVAYGETGVLHDLLRWLSHDRVASVLSEAIAAHVNEMSAHAVYELTIVFADYISPAAAKGALFSAQQRAVSKIPISDLEMIDVADVPTTREAAIARFLFALASDCDTRIRWRTAHAIRRFASFGDATIIENLIDGYFRTNEASFRAAGAPFYWLAARLWLLIAIDRIASENPQILSTRARPLFKIAMDGSLPHALIRAFAKDIALRQVERGELQLTRREKDALGKVNTGRLPRREPVNRYGEAPGRTRSKPKNKEFRFHFDFLDTLPYWYSPAARVFANVSQDHFTEVADKWIVDKWSVKGDTRVWDSQPRKNRFSDRSWNLWGHSHGNTPILERYSTYLEWNAMWTALGELLNSEPLAKRDPGEYGTWEKYLKRHLLRHSPNWLADLRSPKPLETQFWRAPKSSVPEWIIEIGDADFLQDIAMTAARNEWIVVFAYHETASSDYKEDVRVNSALVSRESASALVRALQTVEEPVRYGIPEESGNLQVNSPPYLLRGWLRSNSSSEGIDTLDPLARRVGGIDFWPGKAARAGLVSRRRADNTVVWLDSDHNEVFVYQEWSDRERTAQERYSLTTESDGKRLYVKASHLAGFLSKIGLDLLVRVEVTRERGGDGNRRSHSEEESQARYDKVLLLRASGAIEDARGRVGTWRTSS